MRAIYSEEIGEITGEEAHHLIKVVRIKVGEKILVLNGKGKRLTTEVSKIEKDRVTLNTLETKILKKKDNIHLAIGLPKKEAFEEVLRLSTELGISKIFPLKSEFSQSDFELNDRVKRVLVSSLIQSNNPFFPDIQKLSNMDELLKIFPDYDKIIYFCSHSTEKLNGSGKVLIIIGPEGGFSKAEEDLFAKSHVDFCHIPSFILRTPTAVAASMGWVLATIGD